MSALDEVVKKVIENGKTHHAIVDTKTTENAVWELTAMREKIEYLKNTIAETNAWFVENGHEGTPPQRKLIDLLLEVQ